MISDLSPFLKQMKMETRLDEVNATKQRCAEKSDSPGLNFYNEKGVHDCFEHPECLKNWGEI